MAQRPAVSKTACASDTLTTRREALKQMLLFSGAAMTMKKAGAVTAQGGWSTPAEIIYSANASSPFIATDNSGNCVAIWYDVNNGSLQAATLSSGAVNVQGQPAWILTNPIALANAQPPQFQQTPAVAMDAQGNALAVWTDGSRVYAARLSAGQTTWTVFPPINSNTQNVYAPAIAIASNGNAVASWTNETAPYVYQMLANSYDAQSGQWRGEQDTLAGDTQNNSTNNNIVVDASGNAIAVTAFATDQVKVSAFNFAANTWTVLNPLVFSSQSVSAVVDLTLDASGNALFSVVRNDGLITVATLPANDRSAYIQHATLSTTLGSIVSLASVKADRVGYALTVWSESTGGLGSARYSSATGVWSVLPVLALGHPPNFINLYVDARGNAVAAWLVIDDINSTIFIETAALAVGATAWSSFAALTPTTDQDLNQQVIITSQGDALILWENDTIIFTSGSINASKYANLFPLATSIPQTVPLMRGWGQAALALLLSAAAFIVGRRQHKQIDARK